MCCFFGYKLYHFYIFHRFFCINIPLLFFLQYIFTVFLRENYFMRILLVVYGLLTTKIYFFNKLNSIAEINFSIKIISVIDFFEKFGCFL